jgi:2-keto-4-pentenoate hydratase
MASARAASRRGLTLTRSLGHDRDVQRFISAGTTDVVQELAGRLVRAERQRVPIPAPSAWLPGLSVEEAYEIQDAIVGRRLEGGELIVGWKIGLTSADAQEQFGADEPDRAPILSDRLVRDGDSILLDELIQPRVAAGIAMEIARPLAGPGMTGADVLAYATGFRPTIEVLDSRIEDWRIRLPDTIADMASSARLVVGDTLTPPDGIDPRRIGVALERNGKGIATGTGTAVLGDPLRAVAWLANVLGRMRQDIEVGHIVMTGALHASVPAERGDTFRAFFDRLGSVSVSFD